MTDSDDQVPPSPTALPGGLAELAGRYGVSTEFWDWQGNRRVIPAATVVAALAALGVEAGDEQQVQTSLAAADEAPWRRILPPTVVVRAGQTPWVPVHVPHGESVVVWAELEDGGGRDLVQQ
ncbi:MAG TPA: 4-alpha-glucanotransferase, partial [Actinomycetales bacterium]|nr:4-alpha-glucanotransferase [Actinomycetales bacterium]